MGDESGISLVVLNPSQIKSADPLALDESGKLITPDQWAQEDNPNIHYSPAGEAMKWVAELTGAKTKTTFTGGTYNAGGALSPDGKLDKRTGDSWRASRHKIAATKRYVDMLVGMLVKAVKELRKEGIEVPNDTMNTALGNLDNPLTSAQREKVRQMRELDEEEANALEGAFIAKNREAFKVRQRQALAMLPSPVALIIGEMTEHITYLSTILRNAGFLDKNLMATLTKNLGMYLHRSYEIFDNPKFAEQIRKNTPVMQAAAKLIKWQIDQRNAVSDQLGKPALLLEADHTDGRAYSVEQADTRISAFLELLGV